MGTASSNEWVRYELVAWDGKTSFVTVETDWLNPSSGWHRITFSCDSANGTGVVYVDGAAQRTWGVPAGQNLSGYFTQNALGHSSMDNPAPKGLVVDDICVRAAAVTAEEESAERYVQPDANDSSVTLCLTFPDGDLAPESGSDVRHFTEDVSGKRCAVSYALRSSPGAPQKGNGVFQADSTPVIYRQPDATKPGYNPNEEHAFVGSGSGGYFAWALRCDMNTAATSEPGVLVQYAEGGRPKMRYFAVVPTNEDRKPRSAWDRPPRATRR